MHNQLTNYHTAPPCFDVGPVAYPGGDEIFRTYPDQAKPASGTMGTGSFPGVKSGRGVTLTPYPLLVSRS